MKLLLVMLLPFFCVGCKKKEAKAPMELTYTVSKEKLDILKSADVTIQIDPSFPYYKNRSSESIADEIALAGYKAVHYFVTNENIVDKKLIDAFHNRGLKVWLLTLGNGTYSTSNYPAGWEDWKMKLSASVNGATGFTFLSPFNKSFVEWKKKSLVRLMVDYPFDGIELAETYFPEWDAIATGIYGDIGPNAQKAFKAQYNLEMLNFSDFSSANYYKKHPDIYEKWIEFRVNGINDFLYELINGKGGIREMRPDALVATWSLAIDAGSNSLNKMREDQGLDAAAMISKVKPDIHFFQTHWPDWVKSEEQLPPDYMKNYQPFVDQVKRVHPNLLLGLQADIGSQLNMIKSSNWVKQFDVFAKKYGYTTWTSYEYHLGGYIYTDKPVPKKAIRNSKTSITIAFNKRIDLNSASNRADYSFTVDNIPIAIDLIDIKVDGNWLILDSNNFPEKEFKIAISNIQDTPSLWYYKGFSANEVPSQSEVIVK